FRQGGERFGVEYRILARDGRYRWVHHETVVVSDDQGKPSFLQGFVLDISGHRRAAEIVAAQRAVLELIARGAPLGRVLDELRARIAEILDGGELTVGVAGPDAEKAQPS